jgi:hypothetical protein
MKDIWMYIGITGGCVYIIINLVLLIELSYVWTDKLTSNRKCKCFWYSILIILIVFFIAFSVTLTIYLYINFVPDMKCKWNNLFISIISGSCFIFFIFAICVAAKTSGFCCYLLFLEKRVKKIIFFCFHRKNLYLFIANGDRLKLCHDFGLVSIG